MAQGMEDIASDFRIAGIEGGQELFDCFARGIPGAGTGIRYFRQTPPFGKMFNPVFFQKSQGANDGQTAFKQRLLGKHGADFPAEKHI